MFKFTTIIGTWEETLVLTKEVIKFFLRLISDNCVNPDNSLTT